MAVPPFDVKVAHRWFAVELNNRAWQLIEADHPSAAELELMIQSAHAACLHWLEVGDLLNHLRAQCLLATAYAKAGLAEAAVRHAERCLSLSGEAGASQTDFDRATAHGCASAAFSLAGRTDEAGAQQRLAVAVVDTFADAEEKQVFNRLYSAARLLSTRDSTTWRAVT